MHTISLTLRESWPRRVIEAVANQLFPPVCGLCGTPGKPFCDACSIDLDEQFSQTCEQCAIGLPAIESAAQSDTNPDVSRICGACLRDRPAYDRSLAGAVYTPPFDQLVLGLKYHAQLALAPMLAARLAGRCFAARAAGTPLPDVLLPVPLSRARLAERGFNQAFEIARPLGRALGIPVMTAVLRIRDTPPQASLPFEARRKNIRNAFYLPPEGTGKAQIAGLRIGVVDDVMTTGSTLHELARILKLGGALEVINLVAARTPKSDAHG